MATPQTIITSARSVINDADSVLYRNTDADLLGYVNEGIQTASVLRPDWWRTIGDLVCTAGAVEQTVAFASAQKLLEVLCIHGGAAVVPFDWDAMNAFNPNWRTDTAGAAKQWCRHQEDPLRFFIYPPAPASQTLDVVYTRIPVTLTLTDTITELPSGAVPALIDYVIYRAESKDDEHSDSGRAKNSLDAFTAAIKGA